MNILSNLRVVELEGLAPSVFCGQVLADYGAQVVVVARPGGQTLIPNIDSNYQHRNKQAIVLDLKTPCHRMVLSQMLTKTDILIDCYSPGQLERLVDLPALLLSNPRLIICRLSGYGQTGPHSLKAGHDLNYLARSGLLPFLGLPALPSPPANLLADMCGGSLLGLIGVLMLLHRRSITNQGGIVD